MTAGAFSARGIQHVACARARGYQGSGRPRKYAGKCVICGQTIEAGAAFTWSRDNENGARHGTSKASDDTSKASDDTSTTTTSETDDTNDDANEESDDMPEATETNETAPKSRKLSAIGREILREISPHVTAKASVNEDQVRAIVASAVKDLTIPKRVEVVLPTGETKDAGIQHKQFPQLLRALAAGCNVWITGQAGTGKTYAVHAAAKALGIGYHYTGSVADPYALMGYCDASGRYVRTQFREAFENGGLFLFDEVDGSDPRALLAFNAALANGSAAFPDGMIDRHEKTVIAATANTWGHGADASYVGRARLDGAFLDRFVQIAWQADEALELATCPNTEWAKRVQEVRRRVAERGLKVLVTPRASYNGAKLLAAGESWDEVEAMTIRKGMTAEQWKAVS